jgi:hypothetical protein
MSDAELIIAIPGPWADRKDFLTRVVTKTAGEFMFAGLILACPKANDHVGLELYESDPNMRRAFEYAGRGKLGSDTLDAIAAHRMTAYLHFRLEIPGQQERLRRFTGLLHEVGGLAVKIETSGVAHEWSAWEEILASANPFDLYRGFVTLIADDTRYYSCGMHHFSLAEAQVSRSVPITAAADVLNRFNYYRIVEAPHLESGHTFSISADSGRYRLKLLDDHRHGADDLFHNVRGVWDLTPVN